MSDCEVRYGSYGGLMGAPSQGIIGGLCSGSLSEALAQQQVGATYMLQAQNQWGSSVQTMQNIIGMQPQYQGYGKPEKSKKKVTMFGSIKKYFDDHRDLLMTLAVLVIVDQWVFDGAFKEKIKGLIDRVVGHADNKIKQLEAKQ